jgi:hypothetical protein
VPSHSSGDLIFFCIELDNDSITIDSMTGSYTKLARESSGQVCLEVWYKTAGGSESSTETCTLDLGNPKFCYGSFSVSGQASTSPVQTAQTDTNGSGGTATSPTITVAEDESIILRFLGSERDWDDPITDPTGYTLIFDENPNSEDIACAACWEENDSGASGTEDWSYTPTWHSGQGHIVTAVKPAAGGGATSPKGVFGLPLFGPLKRVVM